MPTDNPASGPVVSATWADRFPGLLAVQTTRHGGVSSGSLGSLNLGWYTKDRPENVRENYRRLGDALAFDPVRMAAGYQVHGSEILRVAAPGQTHGYDAFVTDRVGILLSVTVADCTPVLLYDPVRQVVAAVHAGWRGTVAGIAEKTVAAMHRWYGTEPRDCWAYIGACIDYADYQVDADVADHFAPAYRRWEPREEKYYVDLKGSNRDRLLGAGLRAERIEVSPFSTLSRAADFFSHRAAAGRAGRGIALIGRPDQSALSR